MNRTSTLMLLGLLVSSAPVQHVRGQTQEKRLQIHMQAQPWGKVFDWLTEVTGKPVSVRAAPTGTFTLISPKNPPRTYTIPQVIDLVNDALIAQKHLLLRREESLVVVSADEKLEPSLIDTVAAKELSGRGRNELVRVVLEVKTLKAQDLAADVKKLLGVHGEVRPVGNRLVLVDLAGNLREVVKLLHDIEARTGAVSHSHRLKFCRPEEVKKLIEEILGTSARKDGRFSVSADAATNTVVIQGSEEQVALARVLLRKIDVGGAVSAPLSATPPVLKMYAVPVGRADAFSKFFHDVLRDATDVKIMPLADNQLLVWGRADRHVLIGQALESIGAGPHVVETINLSAGEAERSLRLLKSLFGRDGPAIEHDAERNVLILRGTREQVAEVKGILGQSAPQSNVRTITVEQGSASVLADALANILASRGHPVRIIVPGKVTPEPKPKTPPRKQDGKVGAEAKAPVTIVAAGNRLMVSSDDRQAQALALDAARLITGPGTGDFEVIRVRHARAEEIAKVLDGFFNGGTMAKPGPLSEMTKPRPMPRLERIRVVADPTTNSLLIKAAPLDLLTIRKLVGDSLDAAETEANPVPSVLVITLKHADAAGMAKLLTDLFGRDRSISFVADPRSNNIVARLTPAVEREVIALIGKLDVPAKGK